MVLTKTFIILNPKNHSMPLAVTHVLLPVIIAGLYRDYVTRHKNYFTLHTVFLAGFFGLLPDIDHALQMLANFFNFALHPLLQHGGFFHTPLFALIILAPGLALWYKSKYKPAFYFIVGFFAINFHIFLDVEALI